MQDVEFKGKEMKIGGQVYVLPPLGLDAYSDHGAMKKIQAVMKVFKPIWTGQMNEMDFFVETEIPAEIFGHVADLIYLAFKRNYPDFMEFEKFKPQLNLIEAIKCVGSVIQQSEPEEKNAKTQLKTQKTTELVNQK